jgi:hypothetical protein
MSTIATEVVRKPVSRTPKREATLPVSILTKVKSYFIKHRMAKAWGYRNLLHGEVFIETLEVDHIIFQQNCFIEASKAIEDKLHRLHFEVQTVFPDVEYYQDFCVTHYNSNHNISICLYLPKYKEAILTSQKIADKTTQDIPSGLSIFLNSINILVAI